MSALKPLSKFEFELKPGSIGKTRGARKGSVFMASALLGLASLFFLYGDLSFASSETESLPMSPPTHPTCEVALRNETPTDTIVNVFTGNDLVANSHAFLPIDLSPFRDGINTLQRKQAFDPILTPLKRLFSELQRRGVAVLDANGVEVKNFETWEEKILGRAVRAVLINTLSRVRPDAIRHNWLMGQRTFHRLVGALVNEPDHNLKNVRHIDFLNHLVGRVVVNRPWSLSVWTGMRRKAFEKAIRMTHSDDTNQRSSHPSQAIETVASFFFPFPLSVSFRVPLKNTEGKGRSDLRDTATVTFDMHIVSPIDYTYTTEPNGEFQIQSRMDNLNHVQSKKIQLDLQAARIERHSDPGSAEPTTNLAGAYAAIPETFDLILSAINAINSPSPNTL